MKPPTYANYKVSKINAKHKQLIFIILSQMIIIEYFFVIQIPSLHSASLLLFIICLLSYIRFEFYYMWITAIDTVPGWHINRFNDYGNERKHDHQRFILFPLRNHLLLPSMWLRHITKPVDI